MRKFVVWVLMTICLNAQVYIFRDDLFLKRPIKSWIEFKNDSLVRQEYDYSCGSASIATILKYYYNDDKVTERDVINEILKSKGYDIAQNEVLKQGDGIISFLDLSRYAQMKGFRAVGLAVNFEDLSKLKIPAIIFVSVRGVDHFTVYKNMDKEYVYLSDPSFGNIKIRIDRFKEMFFQRKDAQYPGKILAILSKNKKLDVNHSFMNIAEHESLIYELIKEKIFYP